MQNADYRGVFNPASSHVFVPTGKSSIDAVVSIHPSPITQSANQPSTHLQQPESSIEERNRQQASTQASGSTRQKPSVMKSFNDFNKGTIPGRRHYIAEAIENQGLSISYCARRLGLPSEEVIRQINPQSNLTLEQLFNWSEALDVPLPELLPFDAVTSDPIRNRALLLRIMKTARQLQRISHDTPLEYAVATLVAQLLELVPDFETVEAWPSVGKSRVAQTDGISLRRVDTETSRIIEGNS